MRKDGRQNDEMREIKFTRDYTKYAKGSVLVEFGDTKVLVCATVENAKPKWMPKEETSGWITAEYSLLPTSTTVRCQRERTKLSGRTQEIQRLIGRSLRACTDLEKLGERTVTIDADVIQADGGTRVASICGGFVALNDLFNKMVKEKELEENPIIEPIGDKKIASFISDLAKSMSMLVALLVAVSFMYMVMTGLVMCSANLI